MDFLTIDEVTGQSVRTGFVRLSVLKKLDQILWQGNSKLHELDEIYQGMASLTSRCGTQTSMKVAVAWFMEMDVLSRWFWAC